jgi:hypothetical protein
MTLRSLVSHPPTRDSQHTEIPHIRAETRPMQLMANSSGTADGAETTSNEKKVNGQAEPATEDGAEAQFPDSRSIETVKDGRVR